MKGFHNKCAQLYLQLQSSTASTCTGVIITYSDFQCLGCACGGLLCSLGFADLKGLRGQRLEWSVKHSAVHVLACWPHVHVGVSLTVPYHRMRCVQRDALAILASSYHMQVYSMHD